MFIEIAKAILRREKKGSKGKKGGGGVQAPDGHQFNMAG